MECYGCRRPICFACCVRLVGSNHVCSDACVQAAIDRQMGYGDTDRNTKVMRGATAVMTLVAGALTALLFKAIFYFIGTDGLPEWVPEASGFATGASMAGLFLWRQALRREEEVRTNSFGPVPEEELRITHPEQPDLYPSDLTRYRPFRGSLASEVVLALGLFLTRLDWRKVLTMPWPRLVDVIAPTLPLAAALLFFFGIAAERARRSADWTPTSGTVALGWHPDAAHYRRWGALPVTFTYVVEGQRHAGVVVEPFWHRRHGDARLPGQAVQIYYDPARPDRYTAQRGVQLVQLLGLVGGGVWLLSLPLLGGLRKFS